MNGIDLKNRLLAAKECAAMFSVHKVTWWRWCKDDPDAPKPFIREGHLTRWRLSDVIAYMECRAARCA